MWALALWDTKTRTLLLARDRMGKKPLYFQSLPQGFSCASELPALRCLSADPWCEDLDSTADYLRHGYYLPGTTAYEGVHEVLPGRVANWHPGEEVVHRPLAHVLDVHVPDAPGEHAVPHVRHRDPRAPNIPQHLFPLPHYCTYYRCPV